MATWKKILVEGDAVADNLATSNLTQSDVSRIYDVGDSQALNFDDGIVSFRDSSSTTKLQINANSTPVIGLLDGGSLRFSDVGNSNFCTIDVPTNITSNYAITLPSAGPGAANKILESDASGNLSWITTPSGGVTINNNTDNYLLTASGTANTINGESNLRFDGTELGVSGYLEYQPDANVRYGEFYDGSENGPYMGASGNSAGDLMLWVKDGSVAAFKVHTINGAGGQPELLDASSSSTNINQIAGITVIASSTSSSFYVRGMVTIPQAAVNGTFSSSYGDPLYLDPASAGVLTLTAPTTSNAYRRQMGYLVNKVVISTVNYYIIWFDPSPEYVKIA